MQQQGPSNNAFTEEEVMDIHESIHDRSISFVTCKNRQWRINTSSDGLRTVTILGHLFMV